MGKMPLLPRVLTLATLLPVPPLAVIFLTLAYVNIVNLKQQKDKENISNLKICLSSVSIFLAIFLVFLSLTTMTLSNLTITSRMQKNWNSTQDVWYDTKCPEEEQYSDNYGYYRTTTTTTAAPTIKPVKCYGKTLDQQVQDRMTFFSISQLTVSETLLFFSLVIILTGRRLTKKHLFIPGILLFASATSTCVAFFIGLDKNFDGYENSNLFLITLFFFYKNQ